MGSPSENTFIKSESNICLLNENVEFVNSMIKTEILDNPEAGLLRYERNIAHVEQFGIKTEPVEEGNEKLEMGMSDEVMFESNAAAEFCESIIKVEKVDQFSEDLTDPLDVTTTKTVDLPKQEFNATLDYDKTIKSEDVFKNSSVDVPPNVPQNSYEHDTNILEYANCNFIHSEMDIKLDTEKDETCGTSQSEHPEEEKRKGIHKCNICNKAFTKKGHLENHYRKHNDDPFKCEICLKQFTKKVNLHRHMIIHTGHRPYECEICKKSFAQKSSLQLHQQMHNNEKPFECETCQKTFRRKYHLTEHKRVHTGEFFQCNICSDTFTSKQKLTRHNIVHSDKELVKCDICLKEFTHPDSLFYHKRSLHVGVKPHECEVCHKTFVRRTNLVLHRRVHTGEKPYNCEKCGKFFNQVSNFNRHVKACILK